MRSGIGGVTEEFGSGRGVYAVEVEEGEEVDGAEIVVDGGWSADFGADGEVGAEESGDFHWVGGQGVEGAFEGGPWVGAKFWGGEVAAEEVGIGGRA